MNRIGITKTNSSFDLFNRVKPLIDSIGTDAIKSAQLSELDLSPWNLVIECTTHTEFGLEEFEICICVTSTGYEDTDPRKLVDILKYAGFKFDERDILEKEWSLQRLEK